MMLHRSRYGQLNLIMTVIGLMYKARILSPSKATQSPVHRTGNGMLLCSHSTVRRARHDLAAWKRNVLR
jgi:hypothetical protein